MNFINEKIILQAYTKSDFTDLKVRDFIKSTDDLTMTQYQDYFFKNEIESKLSIAILKFLSDYENGIFMPDKCDAYEPIKDKFDKNHLKNPVRWLSLPGGAVYFTRKKNIKYEAKIENYSFAPVWKDKKLLPPKAVEPIFLGEIMISFNGKSLKNIDHIFLLKFLHGITKIINADYGYITTETELKAKHYISEEGQYKGLNPNKGLSGIYWITYFGKNYVNSIGKENFGRIFEHTNFINLDGDCIFCIDSDIGYYRKTDLDKKITTLLGKEYFFDITQPHKQLKIP